MMLLLRIVIPVITILVAITAFAALGASAMHAWRGDFDAAIFYFLVFGVIEIRSVLVQMIQTLRDF